MSKVLKNQHQPISKSESESENENNSECESENNIDPINILTNEKINIKEKKSKTKINNTLIEDILKNYEEQKIINNEIDEHNKKLNKLKIELEKKLNNLKNKSKSDKDLTTKRTFKELPIPLILSKYLNLDKDILLSRPKVLSIFTQKLKDLKLKEGSIITFDENILKELKIDINYIKTNIEESKLEYFKFENKIIQFNQNRFNIILSLLYKN